MNAKNSIKLLPLYLILAWASAAAAEDSWTGADKPKHIAASAISAVVTEALFDKHLAPLERFGVAMIPGVAKELFDMRKGGSGFSGKDLVVDAIGVGLGMGFYGIVIRPNYIGINIKLD